MANSIFLTGGTGYIGSRLIPLLRKRGQQVKALVRAGSESKLPAGATGVVGDALQTDSYTQSVRGSDTFVHLIGVPHPSPAKAQEFHEVDLVSIQVAIKAARDAAIQHFIYLSVAHPAPVMKEFIAVRSAGEERVRESGINARSFGRGTCLVPDTCGRTRFCRFIGFWRDCQIRKNQPNGSVWSRSTRS